MAGSHFALEAVVRHEGQTLARCLLRRGRYIIGHDRKSEISATTESVSAKHARLTVESDDHFFLEDLGSANGTFVNGSPIDALTALNLESEIMVGDATLTFERGGLPAAVFPHLPEHFLRASRYTLGAPIVEGTTSTIFEAQDNVLRRTVAMKVLRPERQADAGQVLAFIRENQITAQLPHAGVLPTLDFGLDEEIGLFVTTRFVEGQSLADLLREMAAGEIGAPTKTFLSLLQIFLKICSTVDFAHSRGVLHTALRPEAVTFDRFGNVFVNHWSFARIIAPADADLLLVQAPELNSSPTLSPYSAPEQANGADDLDLRTDIHALGAILFRVLTLRDFVSADSTETLIAAILQPSTTTGESLAGQMPPPHIPGGLWPERVIAACTRALSPSREDRFVSVSAFKNEIDGWLESMIAGPQPVKRWKPFTSITRRR